MARQTPSLASFSFPARAYPRPSVAAACLTQTAQIGARLCRRATLVAFYEAFMFGTDQNVMAITASLPAICNCIADVDARQTSAL